jgi:hypothetical protein
MGSGQLGRSHDGIHYQFRNRTDENALTSDGPFGTVASALVVCLAVAVSMRRRM